MHWDVIYSWISGISWSSFVPDLIATFLGVIIALFFQKKYEKNNAAEEARTLKNKIRNEIKKIADQVEVISKSNKLMLNPIKMPIYEGLVNSAKIYLLDKYVWYDDMLTIYDELRSYNSWSQYRLTYCSPEDIDEVDSILIARQNELLGVKDENTAEAHAPCSCHLSKACIEQCKVKKGSLYCLYNLISVSDNSDIIDKSLFMKIAFAIKQKGKK